MAKKWERKIEAFASTEQGATIKRAGSMAPVEAFAQWAWPERSNPTGKRGAPRRWRMSWFLADFARLSQGFGTSRKDHLSVLSLERVGRATLTRLWSRAVRGFLVRGTEPGFFKLRPEWIDPNNPEKIRDEAIDQEEERLIAEESGKLEQWRAAQQQRGDETGEAIQAGAPTRYDLADVIRHVDGIARRANEWMRATCEAEGMSPGNFWKLQRRARDLGLVRRNPDGRWLAVHATEPTTPAAEIVEVEL